MDLKLTKDSEKMLCEIYAVYLSRIKNGETKRDAKDFTDLSRWPDPKWNTPDGLDCLTELNRHGFAKRYIRGSFILQDKAIVYMESRFSKGLSEVIDWIAKIKSAIPFV